MLLLSSVFICALLLFNSANAQAEQLNIDLGKNIFTYHLIFKPSDIISPEDDSNVKGVYSPFVVKTNNNTFVMFMGISVYCQNGSVARDSIGYAVSPDGVNNWKFKGYLIEPDQRACTVPLNQWPEGLLYQVNDPTVVFQDNNFYISYTAVKHNSPFPGKECGLIGTAIFDSNFKIVYRNDNYLTPGLNNCNANKNDSGFSRPTYRQLAKKTYELWFDKVGKIFRIPVSNVNQLDERLIQPVGIEGALDIDVFNVDNHNKVLLSSFGEGVGYNLSDDQNVWDGWKPLTNTSSQFNRWDVNGQGSPQFFVDLENCASQIYLAGIVKDGNGIGYKEINLGVAVLREGDISRRICELRKSWQ
ncbi:hypothetical protein TUMEXPCC7403_03055 [Tumidithrix helvetica PCC 7403]